MLINSNALKVQLEKVNDLESRIAFQMSVVSKKLDHYANSLLKETNINLTSYRVMNIVNTFGASSISDISRLTAMDRAQISRIAVNLEEKGLVVFSQKNSDKRKKLIELSNKGDELIASLLPVFKERRKKVRELLGEEVYDFMLLGLVKLVETID